MNHENIFNLVDQYFDEERSGRNNESRVDFFNSYNELFVLTEDGSYSINSKEINNKIERDAGDRIYGTK